MKELKELIADLQFRAKAFQHEICLLGAKFEENQRALNKAEKALDDFERSVTNITPKP